MPTLFTCGEVGRMVVVLLNGPPPMKSRNEIVKGIWRALEPELEEQGYELIEVEFGCTNGRQVLRLYIDKEGGVSLNDCQAVSQFANPLLDLRNVVPGRHVLEVSSPGIDRPLRQPKDFLRFAGDRVKLTTYEPVEGRKHFSGTLKSFEDGLVAVECEGTPFAVHIENIKKAHLDR